MCETVLLACIEQQVFRENVEKQDTTIHHKELKSPTKIKSDQKFWPEAFSGEFLGKETSIAEQGDLSGESNVDPIKIDFCIDNSEPSPSNTVPESMSVTCNNECNNLGTPIEIAGHSIIYDQDVINRLQHSLEELHNETKIMLNKVLNNQTIIMQYITSDKGVDFLEKLNPRNGLKKQNFNIPIASVVEFDRFMDVLKANPIIKKDTCSLLNTCMDKDHSITKSLVTMLKMFLTKNLASSFTASKQTIEKRKFSDIHYFSIV
ncbi:hypothetical protein PV325_011121 [Microctonus aethiopoides]|nr:hypothetical protein PV325_011121 [Microctonus aethiopoides]